MGPGVSGADRLVRRNRARSRSGPSSSPSAPASPSPSRPIPWAEVERLLEDGCSITEVALWLRCSHHRLRAGLRERGIRARCWWRCTREPHGQRLYNVWSGMRQRCESPRHEAYAECGAKGIAVCEAWLDFDVFYAWAMAAGYAPDLRLDRRNVRRDFGPRNCRWVDVEEHRERHPRMRAPRYAIRAFGETKGLTDWTRDPRCRVKLQGLRKRLAKGWPPAEAIAAPHGARPSRLVTPPEMRRRRPGPTERGGRATIDWKEAARLHRQGLPTPEIARRYGAAVRSIRAGLVRLGEWRPPPPRPPIGPETRRIRALWDNLMRRSGGRGGHGRGAGRGHERGGSSPVRLAAEWRSFDAFHEWALRSGVRRGLWLALRPGRHVHSPANCEWVPPHEAQRRRRREARRARATGRGANGRGANGRRPNGHRARTSGRP
jgi:hypothetical protein